MLPQNAFKRVYCGVVKLTKGRKEMLNKIITFFKESWEEFIDAAIWTSYWVDGYTDDEIELMMKKDE